MLTTSDGQSMKCLWNNPYNNKKRFKNLNKPHLLQRNPVLLLVEVGKRLWCLSQGLHSHLFLGPIECQENTQAHELKMVIKLYGSLSYVTFSECTTPSLHPQPLPPSLCHFLFLVLLYQSAATPWEAQISSAHPEELMTSNVPVNA